MRTRIGLMLLSWALRMLPLACSASIGARRGLAEQRDYDRYEGYTLLLGGDPLPFDRWREQWRWVSREVHRKLPGWRQTDAQLDAVQLKDVVRFRMRAGRVVPMRKAASR